MNGNIDPSILTGLPPEALRNHVAFLSTSDAGKTYAAKGEAELLMDAGERICVIDPTGVWWGLRMQPDGKTPSEYRPVIIGGLHADIPLDPTQGARLAELISNGAFSAIIDTQRLTVADRTRFFVDFAEAMSAREDRRPLYLLIDEAHLFAPQGRVFDPLSAQMVHAANNLVSGGRVLGLRITLISQRPAKLHKDAVSQAQTLVAMFTMAPHDKKAISDWLKDNATPEIAKQIMGSLAGLPVGEGWVYAPRLGVLARVKFRPLRTFDSSASPTDAAAAQKAAKVRLGPLDIEQLKAKLAASAEDEDPRPTAARSVDLKVNTPVHGDALKVAKQEGFEEGRVAGYAEGLAEGERAGKAIGILLGFDRVREVIDAIDPASMMGDAVAPAAPETPKPAEPPSAPAIRAERIAGPTNGQEMAGHRLALAIGRYPHTGLSWDQACTVAKMYPANGYFYGGKKAALEGGDVVERNGRAFPAVHSHALGPTMLDKPLSRFDFRALWGDLKSPAIAMLGELIKVERMSADQLAEALSLKTGNGHWHAGLHALRKAGLVVQTDAAIALSPLLMDAPIGNPLSTFAWPAVATSARAPAAAAAPRSAKPAPEPAARSITPNAAGQRAAQELTEAARTAPRPLRSWSEAAILAGRLPRGPYFDNAVANLPPSPPLNDAFDAERLVTHSVALTAKLAGRFTNQDGAALKVFVRLYALGPQTREQLAEDLQLTRRGPYWDSTWAALRRSPFVDVEGDTYDICAILRALQVAASKEAPR